MDITTYNTKLYVKQCVEMAELCSRSHTWKELKSPTQQSGTRTDPVRGSSVLEFPHKNLNRGHRGASTMGYGPQEAEEWTRLGLKTREEDEGMLE